MKQLVGIVAAFAVISVLGFLAINWVSTVPAPSNTTSAEYYQYTNLTNTSDMAFTASEAVMWLVIVVMVFAGILLLAKWFL